MTEDNSLRFLTQLTFWIKWANQRCFAHQAVAFMAGDDMLVHVYSVKVTDYRHLSVCILCEGRLLQTLYIIYNDICLLFTMIYLLRELRGRLK